MINKTEMSRNPYNLPWKFKLLGSLSSFLLDLALRPDGSVNRFLATICDLKTSASPNKPVNGVTSTDITVDKSRNLWFRLYTPKPTSAEPETGVPVIFYFHGGGFMSLSASFISFDALCRRLAKEVHAVVVSVNYRLAPEHKYPCQYQDCFDVLKFIDSSKSQDGSLVPANANLEHSFLAGDSAGGNAAHHVAVKANGQEFVNIKLIGIVSLQPFFGGEERTDSEMRLPNAPFLPVKVTDKMWRAFLPEGANRDHPATNIFGPDSDDISGLKLPPMIVFVGGLDHLQDWQKRYCEGLKKCGKEVYMVEYPSAFHSFYAWPNLPEYSLAINEVKEFVQRQILG